MKDPADKVTIEMFSKDDRRDLHGLNNKGGLVR